MGAAGKVIAVGNLKGGVGKSTLAVNLGCALAARKLSTVLIDTDPQQTAMAWTRGRRLPCHVRPRPIRELSAVGAWLEDLAAARQDFARVVIDLPAALSPALAAAFLTADAIVIPTSFSAIDLEATRRTVRHAKTAAAERAANPPVILAVPMLIRRTWLGTPAMPPSRRRAMEIRIASPIGYDPAFATAFEQSDWIGGRHRRSRAARELLAVADLIEAGLAEPVKGAAREEPEPILEIDTSGREPEPRLGGLTARDAWEPLGRPRRQLVTAGDI
jgi:chromosome partitioning protein